MTHYLGCEKGQAPQREEDEKAQKPPKRHEQKTLLIKQRRVAKRTASGLFSPFMFCVGIFKGRYCSALGLGQAEVSVVSFP